VNDHDLLTAVREDFAAVRMDTSAETILARGSSRRRRRRRTQVLAMAAVTLAVLGLCAAGLTRVGGVPGSPAERGVAQRPSRGDHTGGAALAAWTIVKQPDGAIAVTIHDLQNIVGLQQRLNAARVPADVYARVRQLPGCIAFPDTYLLSAIVTTRAALGPDAVYFVIHPAAIPQGSTLQVDVLPPGWPPPKPAPHQQFPPGTNVGFAGFGFGSPTSASHPTVFVGLVYTNSNCS
jgi:hypothetical protein